MNWFTSFVLYTIIWWTVLFMVLPFGTRPIPEADEATGWRGAPERPLIGRKMLATTAIAAVLWGIALAVISSDWFTFRTQG